MLTWNFEHAEPWRLVLLRHVAFPVTLCYTIHMETYVSVTGVCVVVVVVFLSLFSPATQWAFQLHKGIYSTGTWHRLIIFFLVSFGSLLQCSHNRKKFQLQQKKSASQHWEGSFMAPLPKRGGSKPEYSEKPPDNQPENRYHTLVVKIHHPNRELNLHPLILVISSLGQNAPAELSYRLLAAVRWRFFVPCTQVKGNKPCCTELCAN